MRCGDGRLGRPTEISMRWYEAVGTKLRLLQPQRAPHHARRTMPAAPCRLCILFWADSVVHNAGLKR